MANRRTIELLPSIFKTDANRKFLGATLDQFVSKSNLKKVNGYIGRKFAPSYTKNDGYVQEIDTDRNDYQLELGTISFDQKNNVDEATSYIDLLNQIEYQGGINTVQSRLFENESYNYDPHIDLDKFVNFSQYYWLPTSPLTVDVFSNNVNTEQEFTVTRSDPNSIFALGQITNTASYSITTYKLSNPTITLVRGGHYQFDVNQAGHKFWIQTEPGVSGISSTFANKSTRNVFGVINNGEDNGQVVFNVPQLDSQDYFINLPNFSPAPTNLATTLSYKDIHHQAESDFNYLHNGIDGITDLQNKRIIFYNNDQINNWYSSGLFDDPVDMGFDNVGFDATVEVPLNQRTGVWQINIEQTNSAFYDSLTAAGTVGLVSTIPFAQLQNHKLSEIQAAGGIDGITNIEGKTVVFPLQPQEWLADGQYDHEDFDFASFGVNSTDTTATHEQTLGVWQITTVTLDGQKYIKLVPYAAFVTLTKLDVLYGYVYSGLQVYRSADDRILTVQRSPINSAGTTKVISLSYVGPLVGYKTLVNQGMVYGGSQFYVDDNGFIQLVPELTSSLDVLYYQDGTDSNAFGKIILIDQAENPVINVERDILGQLTYESPNGIVFTNGLRIRFTGNVLSEQYQDNIYIVEQVGKGIRLVDIRTLITPELYTVTLSEKFDSVPFDITGFDASLNQPTVKDYITINRSSVDVNAWSRSNRWFHKNVIELASQYTGTVYTLDQSARAKRPIIEFDPDIQLYNFGQISKDPINIIDFTITEAFQDIEGVPGYYLDGINLYDGLRVIFAADNDLLVRNRIYVVKIIDPDNDTTKQIHLELADDADSVAGDCLVVMEGLLHQGLTYSYDGTNWILSQNKDSVNQPPLFDVFDTAGVSYSDQDKYDSSSFVGTPIFSYKETKQPVDTELGFGLTYRNFNNIGDIVFNNNFQTDTFTYTSDKKLIETDISSGELHLSTSQTDYIVKNVWTKSLEDTKQYQSTTYFAEAGQNEFLVGISAAPSIYYNNTLVYINNQLVPSYKYVIEVRLDKLQYIVFVNSVRLQKDDKVDIRIYSDRVNTSFSYYEVPTNYENNPFNDNPSTLTLGQMRNHAHSLSDFSREFVGAFPGSSNIRDIGKFNAGRGTLLQHSAPIHPASFFMSDRTANFFASIEYVSREYTRFKNKFISIMNRLDNISTVAPSVALDTIFTNLNDTFTNTSPFWYSDMLPIGDNKTTVFRTVFDPNVRQYETLSVLDYSNASNKSLLVYLNGALLSLDTDYTISNTTAHIVINDSVTLVLNDVIQIDLYNDTDGSCVPETPTKLGMYPKFAPKIELDATYKVPTNVIVGHDGSRTVAFNDYRDQIILEFEKRIFNNVKTAYDSSLIDAITIMPGKFRETEYSRDEFNYILSRSFQTWAGLNNVNYTEQVGYDANNPFTWNYSKFVDRLDRSPLPGGWRGVYRYYFDTETPHLTPWEMLGFTIKPTWWETRYGPAPYTSGNMLMWEELEQGLIYAGDRIGIDLNYARPGLTSIIPVNENGQLLDPQHCIAGNYTPNTVKNSFRFGDVGPAEAAWRKSSDYPFAMMRAISLAKPAKFFGLLLDTNNIHRDDNLGQILNKITNKRISTRTTDIYGAVVNGEVIRNTGYPVWISEYVRSLGLNPTVYVDSKLKNLDLRLMYKMAGFTDKSYIKLLSDQVSPSSLNKGIVIPQENYIVKTNKSAPINQITYSGVIIQKNSNGFIITGYDLNNPFFNIIPSIVNNNNYTIKTGSATAIVYRDAVNYSASIAYGTQINNVQQVVDFLVSYGRYLTSTGLVFNEVISGSDTIRDWTLAAKEFLFWNLQGWQTGSVVSLSPSSNKLKIQLNNTVIDDLHNTVTENKILDQNFNFMTSSDYYINRNGNNLEVKCKESNKGIYLFSGNTVQYESVVILDNTTDFNDIIYESSTGSRQYRLKIQGVKTQDWDGSYEANGFILSDNAVNDWQQGVDYAKGDIVLYQNKYYTGLVNQTGADQFNFSKWKLISSSQIGTGMLPNFTTKADQIDHYYDIDNVNLQQDVDKLGKNFIGFTSRDYLNNLGLDDTTQIKFYQGFIREKGTENAFDKLINANLNTWTNQINVYEEWAARVGSYGALDSTQAVELIAYESLTSKANSVIKFLDKNDSYPDAYAGYKATDLWRIPKNYKKDLFLTRDNTSIYHNDLDSAGYARVADVDSTLFDINNITSLNSKITSMGSGYKLWVANTRNNKSWDIFRVTELESAVMSITPTLTGLRVSCNIPHGLVEGDFIIMKNFVAAGYNITDFNSFYQVKEIASTYFDVDNVLNLNLLSGTVYGKGILFKLVSVRLDDSADINTVVPPHGWLADELVWINNDENNRWAAYKKSEPWVNKGKYAPSSVGSDLNIGQSVSYNRDQSLVYVGAPGDNLVYTFSRTSTNRLFNSGAMINPNPLLDGIGSSITIGNTVMGATGAPKSSNNKGMVVVFTQNTDGTTTPIQILTSYSPTDGDEFGYSVVMSQNERWLYVGVPGANQVCVFAKKTINQADETIDTITGDGVTVTYSLGIVPNSNFDIQVTASDGTLYAPYIDYDVSGSTITFVNAPSGIVIVRQKTHYTLVDVISTMASNPGDRYGESISINDTGRKVLIGAPNATVDTVENVGKVYYYDRGAQSFTSNGLNTLYPITDYNDPTYYRVTVDGVTQTLNVDYTSTVDTITFFTTSIPAAGSQIQIETNVFSLLKTIVPPLETVKNMYFGKGVRLSPDGSRIFIGAPGENIVQAQVGTVYVFNDPGLNYHTVIGSQPNPSINIGESIKINNYVITTVDTNVDSLVNVINNSEIAGISASKSVGKLVITAVDHKTLTVLPYIGTLFDDLGLGLVEFVQEVQHPFKKANENFGSIINITDDNKHLIIGSQYASTLKSSTFDGNNTTFDQQTTLFVDVEQGSGAVYVYDHLPKANDTISSAAQYVYIQQLTNSSVDSGDKFGASVAINGNNIIVGSPGDSNTLSNAGAIYEFGNDADVDGWTAFRQQSDRVDLSVVNEAFLFDKVTLTKITELDYIDPAKGKILGQADQEIDFTSSNDPAIYAVVSDNVAKLQVSNKWTSKEVGKVWWDLTNCRTIEYEQGDSIYRSANWGTYFPGSSFDVYEWIESSVLPSQYFDEANPLSTPKYPDDSAYSFDSTYDITSETVVNKYYYWVKNRDTIPNAHNRQISTTQVAKFISSPTTSNIPYLGFIGSDSIAFYGIAQYLNDDHTILSVNYDVINTDNLLHNEYELIRDGDPNSKLPVAIFHKMVDSLVGVDMFGNLVPDPTINLPERYGLNIRPRQGMFVNKFAALKEIIIAANRALLKYQVFHNTQLASFNLVEPYPVNIDQSVATDVELGYLTPSAFDAGYRVLVRTDSTVNNLWTVYKNNDTQTEWVRDLVQSYNTPAYWTRVDWYSDDIYKNKVPDYTVNFEYELSSVTATAGKLIKINDNGLGQFKLVVKNSDGTYTIVGEGQSTVQISDIVYDYAKYNLGFGADGFDQNFFDQEPLIELRNMLNGLFNDIFISDLSAEANNLVFVAFNYLLTEQQFTSWLFKTSFISIIQSLKFLTNYPIYRLNDETSLEDYIMEVKPYHTKIREFILDYTQDDTWLGYVTDFDVPATFNTVTNKFESPTGLNPGDDARLQLPPYDDWYNNHTYYVDSIVITDPGTEYTDASLPTITIVGGGGSGATAYARVLNGSVIDIQMLDHGTGYTTTPTVVISQSSGKIAKGYPVLKNDTVRSIKTIMKFDRVSYSSDVLTWVPNTSYTADQVVAYNGSAYTVDTDFTSTTNFDSTFMTVMNAADFTTAADRVTAYYAPTEGMFGRDLAQVMQGIEYPGQIITGNDFFYNAGFDSSPFDRFGFDAASDADVNIDEDIESTYTDTRLGVNSEDFTDTQIGLSAEVYDLNGGQYSDRYESHAPEELIPGQVFDTFDIKVFTQDPSSVLPIIGYRIFKDLKDNVSYLRIQDSANTELAQDFTLLDTKIHVVDAGLLATPDPGNAIPGVVFINGERIVYWQISTLTNTISQFRRGTNGTGSPDTHPAGTRVVDASYRQEIDTPTANTNVWYTPGSGVPSDGLGLQASTTDEANFLKSGPSYTP